MAKKITKYTTPFLPPFTEYIDFVNKIYEREWLTNLGPISIKLENDLQSYLDVKNLRLVSNGTVALQLAIKSLEVKDEIITTPFSYVATASSIVWENCKPIFVDIDEHTFNIDPTLIEKAITSKTTAILATHVFGNPCDVEKIQQIAYRYGLKVIYDAAHCFNVRYDNKSLLKFGNVSTLSFHATKIFHTVEGGAVISSSKNVDEKIKLSRNFGHLTSDTFQDVGINAKISEFHAAMGLCNLKYIDEVLALRKQQYILYKKELSFDHLLFQKINSKAIYNYSYFPVVFESEQILLSVMKRLNENSIFPRRYFYPSLTNLNYINAPKLKNSEKISSSILCLPLAHNLSRNSQEIIIEVINKTI